MKVFNRTDQKMNIFYVLTRKQLNTLKFSKTKKETTFREKLKMENFNRRETIHKIQVSSS